MALAVPKIPLMDYVGRPLLACLFVALLLLQWRFPLRRHYFSVIKRLLRNFVLSLPGFAIVRLAMLPIPLMLAVVDELDIRAGTPDSGGTLVRLLKDTDDQLADAG